MSIRHSRGKIVFQLSVSVALGLLICTGSSSANVKVVGYYASWNAANLPYDKVEYSNLTHIIVAFGTPNSNGSLSLESGIPFQQLVSSAHSAGVKVLLSLGGAGSGASFSSATKDSSLRATLIANVINFLQKNDYDGVDIDWETPSSSTETSQLTSLIQETRAAFSKVNTPLLITMAIPAGDYGGQHFDYANMTNYIDWYNIMCYDFVGSWCTYSGQNSPLYQSKNDPNYAGSDSDAIVYNISRGIPRDKLVMGVPFYAVQFNAPGLYQKLTNTTTSNPYYADIVNDLASGWTYHWDGTSQVPYLINSSQTEFITFEDTNSIKLKVQYSVRQQLGGIMIWEISQDLYSGKQPLLETIGETVRELASVVSEPTIVSNYKLFDNYPNPFNPTTKLSYQLSGVSHVTLRVYDVLGRELATLVDGDKMPGKYEVEFDGGKLSSGVYFYTLAAGNFLQTKKMLLLK